MATSAATATLPASMSSTPDPIPRLDFSLPLATPPQLATMPAELRGVNRDEVRLLVLDRATGSTQHARFSDLPAFVRPGDLFVVNTSATIPARFAASYEGHAMMLHLCTRLTEHRYIIEPRTATGGPDERSFESGDVIHVLSSPGDGRASRPLQTGAVLTIERRFHPNSRLWVVHSTADLLPLAMRLGDPIQYGYIEGQVGMSAYDSVFARSPGSAEMPSASRPFTCRTLRQLAGRGTEFRTLTLHTGVSSHEVEDDLAHHPVIPEWYTIPAYTAAAVNRAKLEGRRIIAVGTTVVRALESAAREDGRVTATSDWTTHLVTPWTPPRVATGLVTGFHEDHSSHLALLYGFVEPHRLHHAYQEAVEREYLWHEFGDINLIL